MGGEVEQSGNTTGKIYQPTTFADLVHIFISAPPEKTEEAIKALFAVPAAVFRWLNGLLSELDAHTRDAVAKGDFYPALQVMHDKWLAVAVVLLNNGYPSEARVTGHRLYQVIRSLEVEKNKRFIKGGLLWWMARTCLDSGASEEAKNYFLLAMLEDVRTDPNTWKSLPARDWLVNVTQIAAETIDKIGEGFETDIVRKAPWDTREPEIGWIRSRPHRRRISRGHLDFTKAVACAFHALVDAPAKTTKEKGDRLELLVSYLFAVEQGFEVLGPTKGSDSQTDVIVRNRHHDPAIASLGNYIMVECKNWSEPIGAPIIREFAGKMRPAKIKTGILVCREGVTGQTVKTTGTAARETIAKEYLQDETAVLVLDDKLLRAILAGQSVLSLELLDQFERVRFDIRTS